MEFTKNKIFGENSNIYLYFKTWNIKSGDTKIFSLFKINYKLLIYKSFNSNIDFIYKIFAPAQALNLTLNTIL